MPAVGAKALNGIVWPPPAILPAGKTEKSKVRTGIRGMPRRQGGSGSIVKLCDVQPSTSRLVQGAALAAAHDGVAC